MDDTLTPPGSGAPPGLTYRPVIALLTAAVAVLAAIALCVAAILHPPPAAAAPFVVAVCVGCPLFAGSELRSALTFRRLGDRLGSDALARLRSQLDTLPETEHPLGL
jgi:hypothetical protein